MATSGTKGRARAAAGGAPAAKTDGGFSITGDWARRIRSGEFRQAVTSLIAGEIRALGRTKVRDVVDAASVRKLIAEESVRLVSPESLAELTIQVQRSVIGHLHAANRSLLGLVGDDVVKSVDAMLEEDPVSSAYMEDFVANLMRQEFVLGLFTDVIYTSIVSFNERVNPIFGRLAVGMMEEQIRGFIRLFMPMAVQQATAFATSRRNQAILFDFTRAIVRRLLDEPLPNYFSMVSPAQRKKAERLVRRSFTDARLAALTRDLTLVAWDALYARIRNQKVGSLLELEANAGWLAERIVAGLLPVLSRPAVLRFMAEAEGR